MRLGEHNRPHNPVRWNNDHRAYFHTRTGASKNRREQPEGKARPHADSDVGVTGDEPLPLDDFYAIENRLDDLRTPHKIDWADLNRALPRARERALKQTKTLHG